MNTRGKKEQTRNGEGFAVVLSLLVVFATLAMGAHDLWAATVVYLAVLAGALVLLFQGTLFRSRRGLATDLWLPSCLLLLVFSLSAFQSINPYESFFELKDWIFSLLVFYMALHAFGSDDHVDILLRMMVPVFWAQLGICLYMVATIRPIRWEYPGSVINANVLIAFFLFWIPSIFVPETSESLAPTMS